MARIRTIKPEAFASESLAAVSLSAERTFFGLLTPADDHGRFRDQPAVIAGLLWSLRPDHGPLGVEDDLTQLAAADLICRYEGDDAKQYLHIVTWHHHQKINRPSGVRAPVCPHHEAAGSSEPSRRDRRALREESVSPHGGLAEDSQQTHALSLNRGPAGQAGFNEPSPRAHGGLSEPSMSPQGPDLGPRILDLGSIPSGAQAPPRPAPPSRRSSSSASTSRHARTAHRRRSSGTLAGKSTSSWARASPPTTSARDWTGSGRRG